MMIVKKESDAEKIERLEKQIKKLENQIKHLLAMLN